MLLSRQNPLETLDFIGYVHHKGDLLVHHSWAVCDNWLLHLLELKLLVYVYLIVPGSQALDMLHEDLGGTGLRGLSIDHEMSTGSLFLFYLLTESLMIVLLL